MPDYAQSYVGQDYDFEAHLAREADVNFSPGDPTAVGRIPVRDESGHVTVLRKDLPAGFVGMGVGGSTVTVDADAGSDVVAEVPTGDAVSSVGGAHAAPPDAAV